MQHNSNKNIIPMRHYNIAPDLEEAKYFSSLLFPRTTRLMFQTFDDNKSIQDKSLAHVLVGTLEQHKQTLVDLNKRGAGIYITVNHTEGNERRIKNVTGINTFFIEADHGMPTKLPIKPSFVVESSPKKFHVYFQLAQPYTELEMFRPIMQTLVKEHGSDPNATDITRVLRLPGFFHMKNKPTRVNLVNPPLSTQQDQTTRIKRYLWSQVIKAFPPQPVVRPSFKDPSTFHIIPQTTRIIDALGTLNPECTRARWVNTLASLHDGYQGSDQGLDIAIKWSKGEFSTEFSTEIPSPSSSSPSSLPVGSTNFPVNFANDEDVIYTWNSFTQSNNPSRRRLGSLFHDATEIGWIYNKANPHSVKFINMEAECTLKKIQETHAVVNIMGNIRITWRDPKNGFYNFGSEHDVKLKLKNIQVPVTDTDKRQKTPTPFIKYVPVYDEWVKSSDRMDFSMLEFTPKPNTYYDPKKDDKEKIIKDPTDPQTLNMFYGTYIAPKKGNWKPIQDLVLNGAANGKQEVAEWIHKWNAHLVQKPHEKTNIMPIYMGDKGTGKTMLATISKGLMEPYTFKTAEFKDVLGDFNSHIMEACVVQLEEATWGGDKREESKLKDAITCSSMTRKQKFLANMPNMPVYHNFISTANPGFAIPEEPREKERRFFTMSFSNKYIKNTRFFAQFGYEHDSRRNRLLAAYKDYLLTLDLSKFNPTLCPVVPSSHAAYNRMETLGTPFQFFHNAVDDEQIIPEKHKGHPGFIEIDIVFKDITSINKMWNNKDGHPLFIRSAHLKNAFKEFKKQSPAHKLSVSAFIPYIQQHGIPTILRQTPSSKLIDEYDHLNPGGKYIEIPNRAQCIDLFVTKLGILNKKDYKGEY